MFKISRYPIARAARSAFTLIELLVVIAIVALLVAILLPGLAEARRAGKQAKNVTNMKGMGTASQTYGGENKDVIPAFNRPFLSKGKLLINPMSDWGRKTATDPQSPDPQGQMGIDALDRIIAASGGVSDAMATMRSNNATFRPRARYYPVLLVNYMAGKLPDPSFVNPLDRVRSRIIGETAQFLKDGPDGYGLANNQTVFCFSSSYEVGWANIIADRGGNSEDTVYHETPDGGLFTLPPNYFATRKISEVIFPADKVFMFDRVALQSGRIPMPVQHPNALGTNAFWDGSVRVVRSSDMNIGGYVYGPASNLKYNNMTECVYDVDVNGGDPVFPSPLLGNMKGDPSDRVTGLNGYQKWTMEGLKGRDVGGKQRKEGTAQQ